MKKLYWIAGGAVALGWIWMVGASHENGTSICFPLSARTGPMGLIGCVDSYNMRQGACLPMSASDGPLGLISCELYEEQPSEQRQ